jgi:hypothetical protein
MNFRLRKPLPFRDFLRVNADKPTVFYGVLLHEQADAARRPGKRTGILQMTLMIAGVFWIAVILLLAAFFRVHL